MEEDFVEDAGEDNDAAREMARTADGEAHVRKRAGL
jgi:hypothetical protein